MAVAVTASAALVAALSPMLPSAPASAAEVAEETVVPAAPRYERMRGQLLHNSNIRAGVYGAGAQGFFHSLEGRQGTVWTRYSDGRTVSAPPKGEYVSLRGTSSDVLAYVHGDNRVELWDAVDGTTRTFRMPDGQSLLGVYGGTVFSTHYEVPGEVSTRVLHLLHPQDDGTVVDTAVTGAPEGMRLGGAVGADADTFLFSARMNETSPRIVEVDRSTGRVLGSTQDLPAEYYYTTVSPSHVLMYGKTAGAPVLSVPRHDLSATPVPLPAGHGVDPMNGVAVVGDWVVHRPASGQAVQAVPIGGGEPVTLLSDSYPAISVTPEGGAVIVGGRTRSRDDWGFQRIRPGAGGGQPVVEQVKSLAPPPIPIRGLSLDQGRLVAAQHDGPGLRDDYLRLVAPSGTPEFGDRSRFRPSGYGMGGCPTGEGRCTPIRGTADGRVVWLEQDVSAYGWVRADGPGEYDNWERTNLPAGGQITDVSGRYFLYATAKLLYAYPLDGRVRRPAPAGDAQVTRPPAVIRPAGAAALSGDLLWTAAKAPGSLTAHNLSTRRNTETVAIGADCRPTEIQAVGRWLYWTCEGRAGVYDRTAKKSVPVPTGEAKLGDGFVVTHDRRAGKLTLTAVVGGKPASRVLGDLPDTGASQRDLRWTVDESGPNAAYVDAQERVHLVPSGVPQQPLRLLDPVENAASVARREPDAVPETLTTVLLSKPAASRRLTVRSRTTGKVVDTRDGGAARGELSVGWHGNQRAGSREVALPAGSYDWTLSVMPADGTGAPLEVRGTVRLVR
ncbi:VCBS repeat-containing protein [Streptomyces sp. NPDC059459]|uniref:VCBS repeat-containing protein n=1 Tax=Streptomyces sp. NPDC059459 TaxID=3346839 RepID=UPI0036B23B7A